MEPGVTEANPLRKVKESVSESISTSPSEAQACRLDEYDEDHEKKCYVYRSKKRRKVKKPAPATDKSFSTPNRRLYTPPAVKFLIKRYQEESGQQSALCKARRKVTANLVVRPTECHGRSKREAIARYHGASSLHLPSDSAHVNNSTVQVVKGLSSLFTLGDSSKTSRLSANIDPAPFGSQTTLSVKEIIDSLTSQIREHKLSELKILEESKIERSCVKKSPRGNSKTSVDSNNNKKVVKKSPVSFRRELSSLCKVEEKRSTHKKQDKVIKGSVRSKSLVRTSVSNIVQETGREADAKRSTAAIDLPRDQCIKYLPTVITRSLSSLPSKGSRETCSSLNTSNSPKDSEKGKFVLEIRIPTVLCDSEIGVDPSSSNSHVHLENVRTKRRSNETKKLNRNKQKSRVGRTTFDYNDVLKTDIAKRSRDVKSSGKNTVPCGTPNSCSHSGNIVNYTQRMSVRHNPCEHHRRGTSQAEACVYCNIKQHKH